MQITKVFRSSVHLFQRTGKFSLFYLYGTVLSCAFCQECNKFISIFNQFSNVILIFFDTTHMLVTGYQPPLPSLTPGEKLGDPPDRWLKPLSMKNWKEFLSKSINQATCNFPVHRDLVLKTQMTI